MNNVYNYAKGTPITTEARYPYVKVKQSCRYSSGSGIAKLTGYTNVANMNPSALMQV